MGRQDYRNGRRSSSFAAAVDNNDDNDIAAGSTTTTTDEKMTTTTTTPAAIVDDDNNKNNNNAPPTVDEWNTSQRLLTSIMYWKDRSGHSFLHTKFPLRWAKILLDRAKFLDEQRSSSSISTGCVVGSGSGDPSAATTTTGGSSSTTTSFLLQRRFLLQRDVESGYTPLHRAILESNLPAILLLLRHVTDINGTERFTHHHRPISILHSSVSSASSTSATESLLTTTVGGGNGSGRKRSGSITNNNNNNNSSSSSLANLIVSATDHEGFTPLQLLIQLQRSELEQCRLSLQNHIPQVEDYITMIPNLRSRRRPWDDEESEDYEDDDNDLQINVFNENRDLLLGHNGTGENDDIVVGTRRRQQQRHGRIQRRHSGGDDSTDDNIDTDDDENYDDGTSSYACEVVTFGRGCAVGAISSTSSSVLSDVSTTTPRGDMVTGGGGTTGGKNKSEYNVTSFSPQRVQEFSQEVVGRDGSAIMAAAATHHTLIVLKNGQLYSFGVEKGGRLGLGDDQPKQCPLPRRVLGPLSRRHVVYVAAAENHSLCVTKDGHVYSWGSNRFGQLGDSTPSAAGSGGGGDNNNTNNTTNRSTPRRVEEMRQFPCVQVAAGEKHSVALTRKGEVYVWGDNSSGQLGVPRRGGIQKVQRVEALWNKDSPKVTIAIAASEQATLALTVPSHGTSHLNAMYEWGHGNHVPLRVHFERSSSEAKSNAADESHMDRFDSTKRRIPNPVAIACAKFHNAAIDSDGRVFTWGHSSESLGRTNNVKGNKQSQQKQTYQQRRNSTPQLVTGMLPEKGGGHALRIAASGQHTAVVTDTGALYTWGTTDSKSVLGHEGLRWQPHPRRVPGVHRVVSVAVAKEHTVLLIGTSFPKIPRIAHGPASLEAYTSRKIAEYVDLFNVVPLLVMAERTECNFLIGYCNDFIRKNLDGVLAVGKKRDLNQLLNDCLSDTTYRAGRRFRDDHHHPIIFDVLSAGNCWRVKNGTRQWWSRSDGWAKSCAQLAQDLTIQRLLELADIREYEEDVQVGLQARNRRRTSSCNSDGGDLRQRARSLSGGNVFSGSLSNQANVGRGQNDFSRRILEADASTAPLAKQKHDSLSREIRSVRKKLKQIASLEAKTVILSTDEQAKVGRRSSLESDLKLYETALEEVDRRIRDLDEDRKVETELNKKKSDGSKDLCSTTTQRVTFVDEGLVKNDKKEIRTEDDHGVTISDDNDKFFCELCSVRCSDKSSFLLHQNGRKHRNKAQQVAKEDERKAATEILQQRQAEQLKLGRPQSSRPDRKPVRNAWGASQTAPTPFRLPPPPHPVVSQEPQSTAESPPPPSTRKSSWKADMAPKTTFPPSNVPTQQAEKTPAASFTAILAEEHARKKKEQRVAFGAARQMSDQRKSIWDSSPNSNRCVPLSLYSSEARPSPSQLDFADVQPSRASMSLADFLTPSKAQKGGKSSPGSKTAPQTAWSSPTAMHPALNSSSLVQIVAEEADLREKQDKSYGEGGGSWYVERRERADSILAIQQVTEKEQEHNRLVEEQRAIEAQIQAENLERQRQSSTPKKNTRSRRKNNKIKTMKEGTANTSDGNVPKSKSSKKPNGQKKNNSHSNRRNVSTAKN